MQDEPINKLDKRIIKVWRLTALVRLVLEMVLLIGYALAVYFFDWWRWPGYLLAAVSLLYSLVDYIVLPKLRYRYFRYEIKEDEVEIQRGIFIIQRTIIPMVRIQHVKTEQGPFLRRFLLATLEISSAATSHQIPGLAVDEAKRLRSLITELAKVRDEDV